MKFTVESQKSYLSVALEHEYRAATHLNSMLLSGSCWLEDDRTGMPEFIVGKGGATHSGNPQLARLWMECI